MRGFCSLLLLLACSVSASALAQQAMTEQLETGYGEQGNGLSPPQGHTLVIQGDPARCAPNVQVTAQQTAACPGNATTPIYVRFPGLPEECVFINNNSAANLTYLVPLGTPTEWSAFKAGAPGLEVVITPCSGGTGVCGPAASTSHSKAPSTDLCSVGTPSAVTGTGPWSWTCQETIVGAGDASCSGQKATSFLAGCVIDSCAYDQIANPCEPNGIRVTSAVPPGAESISETAVITFAIGTKPGADPFGVGPDLYLFAPNEWSRYAVQWTGDCVGGGHVCNIPNTKFGTYTAVATVTDLQTGAVTQHPVTAHKSGIITKQSCYTGGPDKEEN